MFAFEPEVPARMTESAYDDFVLEDVAPDETIAEVVQTATGFEPVGERELFFSDLTSLPAAPP